MITSKFLLGLAAAALAICSAPCAASATNPEMDKVIRQMRQTAQQMRGQLPDAAIEQMLRDADELERENRGASFTATAAPAPTSAIGAHMEKVHGSTYEWLARTTTCAGYQWETWRTWNITKGEHIAERNIGCKRAFALFEQYFYEARSGNMRDGLRHLAEYDRAAHQVIDMYPER